MKYFIKCLKHYFDFKGRARRKEYWMFVLFTVIIVLTVFFIELICSYLPFVVKVTNEGGNIYDMMLDDPMIMYKHLIVTVIVWILLLIPTYTVGSRRLHDIGKSGWWILLPIPISLMSLLFAGNSIAEILCSLISFAINILLLVWLCTDSDYETNKWGPCPKTEDGEDYIPSDDESQQYRTSNEETFVDLHRDDIDTDENNNH